MEGRDESLQRIGGQELVAPRRGVNGQGCKTWRGSEATTWAMVKPHEKGLGIDRPAKLARVETAFSLPTNPSQR
jgi:hypothetical protein